MNDLSNRVKEKPRFKVPYCKYCNEYATVTQQAPISGSFENRTKNTDEVIFESVCSDHVRNHHDALTFTFYNLVYSKGWRP